MKALCELFGILMVVLLVSACGGDDTETEEEGGESPDVVSPSDGVEGDAPEQGLDGVDEPPDTGPPATCYCNVDADCDMGYVCVTTPGGWACKPYPQQGLCWNAEDHCSFGSICEDPRPCDCDADCEIDEQWGKCTEGSGCCASDDDCFAGDVCVSEVCKPALPGKLCWRGEDCAAGEECVGENVCPCETECPTEDVEGKCFPEEKSCCLTGADCPLGEACVENMCKANPDGNQCWTDSHCEAGETCEGETPCSCLSANCINETPGSCFGALDCCSTDAECEGAQVCFEGACHMAPSAGQCWSAVDCVDPSATCVGAAACACGVPCANDKIGTCLEPLNCCNSDSECAPGLVCVLGDCKPAPVAGSCWAEDDCLAGQVCEGAAPCPCGLDCDDDSPGTCVAALPPGCCATNDDCVAGNFCLDGVCNPWPAAGECYKGTDCGDNEVCYGAAICPCGANCVSDLGVCEVAGCCTDTMPECMEGWICVPPMGCVPFATGNQCWHNQDCGDGQFCDGAFICGCTADCASPDSPGTCAPF